MKKDRRLFDLTHLGVKIVAVVLLVAYLSIYAALEDRNWKMFVSYIAFAVFLIHFLLYNRLMSHFNKKGFYTSEQAAKFYIKCYDENLFLFQEENIEKAKEIYFSIFGTDKYCGEGTLLTHMTNLYNIGKKMAEKQ